MTPQNYALKHEITIVSIVPFKLPVCIRPLYTPVSHYELKPGTPDDPFHLVIRDAWQPEYKGENVGNQQMLVLAERIAVDVVQDFTERIPGWGVGQHLGVGICKGPHATPKEIAALVAAQDRLTNHRIEQADGIWKREGNAKNISTLTSELAAAAKVDREWLFQIKSGDSKDCPACGERIKAKANVCKHCNTKDLDEYVVRQAKKQPLPPPIVVKPAEVRA